MHMADALLSPSVGITFWAAALAAMGHASRRLRERLDQRLVPLMGVLGAFVFAAQMINFTIPGTGSSGHLGGGLLLAVVLGPEAAFLAMASVLTVQALFFADGGLLALGCNIWNLGFYPAFIAYPLVYRPLAGGGGRSVLLASIAAAAVALQLGAFSVVLETVLSGRSELPFEAFVLFMQPIHLAIGLVEGLVTAGVIAYIRGARPELLEGRGVTAPLRSGVRLWRVAAVLLIAALLTGGALSWFASTRPDGLEWSMERVYGRGELPEREGLSSSLKGFQEKTAVLPDYGFRPDDNEGKASGEAVPTWPAVDAGASVSGITGSLIVLGLIMMAGVCIRALRAAKA